MGHSIGSGIHTTSQICLLEDCKLTMLTYTLWCSAVVVCRTLCLGSVVVVRAGAR